MAKSVITRILRYAVLAASVWYVGVYLVVAWQRLPYPFELEWMEGGAVDHVDITYENGHSGVEQPHYHIVLWHVGKEEERDLEGVAQPDEACGLVRRVVEEDTTFLHRLVGDDADGLAV